MQTTTPRILAIDPGTQHMGVAVVQGNSLVHYGVKTFRHKRPADEMLKATREVLERLIDDYRPGILTYERTFYVAQKSSALLHVQELEIDRLGRARGLTVVGQSPNQIRSLLCRDGWATKRRVAEILAERFPELRPYRLSANPRQERYWSNLFDAIAVGVVCAQREAAVEPAENVTGDETVAA